MATIISAGQSEESYATAFRLLKKEFPAVFNNKNHPKNFMTDNSAAEIEAIKSVWPESQNLLCIFHVLQAVWRWLWDAKNGINKR